MPATLEDIPYKGYTTAAIADRLNALLPLARAGRNIITFTDVATMLADTSPGMADGTLLLTAQGFAYRKVAASTPDADVHLTTAGGAKLQIIPPEGGWVDVRAAGWIANGTPFTTNGTDHFALFTKLLGWFDNLIIPDGVSLIRGSNQSPFIIPPGGTKRLSGTGAATLYIHSTTNLQATQRLFTTLTANVDMGARTIQVASTAGVQVGDLIHVVTTASADTTWGYDKQCVRNVMGVSGTTVTLDQEMDFWFTTAEAGAAVRFYAPATVHMDGVNIMANASPQALNFKWLQGSTINNSAMSGQVPMQEAGFSDVFNLVNCDRTLMTKMKLRKARYLPNILGSRFTTIRDFEADEIRHIDPNSWASDTVIENGIGFRTSSIIQCHPSIRNTWRNIRDRIVTEGIYGLTVRGLGDTVVDCYSECAHGVIGDDVQRPMLSSAYLAMGQRYTRRIVRFQSPHAVITGGQHGRQFIEDCNVPNIGQFTDMGTGNVYIDAKTIITQPTSAANGALFWQDPRPIEIVAEDDYARSGTPRAITGISQANPGVVTATAHGLTDGMVVRINGVSGMLQTNRQFYRVANVAANTFELQTLDGAFVDTSAFATYISGGFATPQSLFRTLNRRRSAAIQRRPKLWMVSDIVASDMTGATTHTIPVKLMLEPTGTIATVGFHGNIRLRVATSQGRVETVHGYYYHPTSGTGTISAAVSAGAAIDSTTATIANFVSHMNAMVTAEGGTLAGAEVDQYYMTFDVVVTVPSTARVLRRVDVEVEQWLAT